MGFLDDTLDKALPKGSSLAKPLMLAFLALLASGALSRKQAPAQAPGTTPPPGTSPASQPDAGGLLGGLGGLLETFQQSGLGNVAKSWVDTGLNQSIPAGSLGSALGPSLIKTLAERTGLSEQEVTTQLAQFLPGVVDKLTPEGRLPTRDEMARFVS